MVGEGARSWQGTFWHVVHTCNLLIDQLVMDLFPLLPAAPNARKVVV